MTGKNEHIHPVACGASAPQATVNPWFKLVGGISLILAFMFGLGSLAQRIPGAHHMAQMIDDYDLRPSAIYYTDFEASAEGAATIRDSLDYKPHAIP